MPFIDQESRNGNFTGSEIWKLLTLARDGKSFGEKARTYIEEKRYERRIGRSLSLDRTGRSALWGKYLESRVHGKLSTGYELIEDRTIEHPTIKYWKTTPDCKNIREDVVGDIKCYEPKKFCAYNDLLTEAVKTNDTELFKDEYPQEYWQLVSGSILLNVKHVEPIVYMPYFSELEEIRASVDDLDSEDDQRKYGFIKHSHYNELAYLQDDRHYKNLNIYRFTPPDSDKKLLTDKVIEAGKLLEK